MSNKNKKLNSSNQIVSRERVASHGEVYTNAREVNAMLDLIPENACTHTARYLEPSCGTGNFLVEILARKLVALDKFYLDGKALVNQTDYEANLVAVTGSLYGIELLADNVAVCRDRLLNQLWKHYVHNFPESFEGKLLDVLRFVLGKNIVHGDALAFTRQDAGFAYEAIVFCEWTLLPDYRISRCDFSFKGFAIETKKKGSSNKNKEQHHEVSPTLINSYSPVFYLDLIYF